MNDFELPEAKAELEPVFPVDLLIGMIGPADESELRRRVVEAVEQSGLPEQGRILVTWQGEEKSSEESHEGSLLMMTAYRPAAVQEASVLETYSACERSILQVAARYRARACLVLAADFKSLDAQVVQAMSHLVQNEEMDLVLPLYGMGRYDGLLNVAILAPMSRALFARRVQFPLPFEFACSARYVQSVMAAEKIVTAQNVLWPLSAALREPLGRTVRIGQLHVEAQHASPFEGLELTAVLSQVVGAFFAEVEQSAPTWQRLRGSQEVAAWGEAQALPVEAEQIEVRSMIESFELAQRNLGELWTLVLPPVTLLELKRLSRMAPEDFRMSDDLWARIVYDFALAYRLRTLARAHLMGALTPLYLAWLASYVQQIATLSPDEVRARNEQLAKVFEENKPYLVSRWRWPDRFNP